jgi:hypothetical protein
VIEFAKYKAPRANEAVLCEPPASDWGSVATANVRSNNASNTDAADQFLGRRSESISTSDVRWSGIPLQDIRMWTRRDAIRLSHCNTNSCSDLTSECLQDSKLWYVSGHQPEFFHPGVWFKNFVLYEAAREQKAVSLNVVIDHDAASPISIAVPFANDDGTIGSKSVALEGWAELRTASGESQANVPWELMTDDGCLHWQKFQDDVSGLLASLDISEPLIKKMVPMIQQSISAGAPIGKAIAAARHQIERDFGIHNYEVLFSQLAQGRGFAAFVYEIISSMESFRDIYHRSRNDYRSHHQIKNESQPIPQLAEQFKGGFAWAEAPFWVYSAKSPTRRALWIRYDDHKIILSDLERWESHIEREADFESVVAWWQNLIRSQVAIRPRALTSTLFMRLAVADLFVHGIGGGKYDQITDLIIERWCGITPPTFAVATATLFLPMKPYAKWSRSTLMTFEARNRLRDYRFNPERLISDASSEETRSMQIELMNRIQNIPIGSTKNAWHESLQELKSVIRDSLAKETSVDQVSLATQIQASIAEDLQQKLRSSREYSIAVFPDGWTQEKLLTLAKHNIDTKDNHNIEETVITTSDAK